LTYQMQPPRN